MGWVLREIRWRKLEKNSLANRYRWKAFCLMWAAIGWCHVARYRNRVYDMRELTVFFEDKHHLGAYG